MRNTGTATLFVTSISSPNPPFSLLSSPAVPFQLAPNAQQQVTVSFSPTTEGAKTSVLSIASNDPVAATVSITLRGSGEPETENLQPSSKRL